ncbi:flagellar basal body rod protein FlgC [Pseudoroseicyclus tamaricis]|uniref:Flagellar basal body rod protein FlgC n=1 Tax=Pseudoroseicyclus tamaricis TaxID=2705421 RepID=A0A6B2JEX6_9RHOB|nr:flagellar basal body rod protein FlgC [Pseudoroseicyclus tamaricis]NDU99500.1 flagellar basal body rod protein FlgC [Pseudoroseicyclus tamaricis]
MSDFADSLNVTASAMRAQSMRLRLTAENVANADTPGYHRKTTSFQAAYEGGRATGLVEAGPVRLDRAPLSVEYDPSNPLADAEGNVEGSNVNLLLEVADAREAGRSYEANLKMFEQIRSMSTELMNLLRRR